MQPKGVRSHHAATTASFRQLGNWDQWSNYPPLLQRRIMKTEYYCFPLAPHSHHRGCIFATLLFWLFWSFCTNAFLWLNLPFSSLFPDKPIGVNQQSHSGVIVDNSSGMQIYVLVPFSFSIDTRLVIIQTTFYFLNYKQMACYLNIRQLLSGRYYPAEDWIQTHWKWTDDYKLILAKSKWISPTSHKMSTQMPSYCLKTSIELASQTKYYCVWSYTKHPWFRQNAFQISPSLSMFQEQFSENDLTPFKHASRMIYELWPVHQIEDNFVDHLTWNVKFLICICSNPLRLESVLSFHLSAPVRNELCASTLALSATENQNHTFCKWSIECNIQSSLVFGQSFSQTEISINSKEWSLEKNG